MLTVKVGWWNMVEHAKMYKLVSYVFIKNVKENSYFHRFEIYFKKFNKIVFFFSAGINWVGSSIWQWQCFFLHKEWIKLQMQSKIKILVEKFDWKAYNLAHFNDLEYWLEHTTHFISYPKSGELLRRLRT